MIPVDVEPVPDRKRHPLEISPSAELDDGQTRPRKRRYVRHPKVSLLARPESIVLVMTDRSILLGPSPTKTLRNECSRPTPPLPTVGRPTSDEATVQGADACVSDQRRERDYSRSSFADIAKHIGNLWKNLPADGKLHYQAQAATAKEDYAKQLALYKLTREYEQYQQYLADWKAEQAQKTGTSNISPTCPRSPS